MPGEFRWDTLCGSEPIVIAHRGASGYLPEHTLEAYQLAVEMGADYIEPDLEPDLVSTKDGHLIARHEPNLTSTTDVATRLEFANRKTTKLIDGAAETGWFASDFTLEEIKQLRAIQPRAFRAQQYNGLFEVPTLKEIITLAKRESERHGRAIGIYPETKHPTYHFALGLPLEDKLLEALDEAGWNDRKAPVFIQSFETANLKYLRTKTKVRLVQLIDADDVGLNGQLTYAPPFDKPYNHAVTGDKRGFADLVTPQGLAEIAKYADGIGPWKRYIVSVRGTDANNDGKADDADKKLTQATELVKNAHNAGLLVHPYTFRSESRFLSADYGGDPKKEYIQFYKLGVDGVFSDFPDTAIAARREARKQ